MCRRISLFTFFALCTFVLGANAAIDYDDWGVYTEFSGVFEGRQYAWVSFYWDEDESTRWGQEITWDDANFDVISRLGPEWSLASLTSAAEHDFVTGWLDGHLRDSYGVFDPTKVNLMNEWPAVSIAVWIGGYQPTDPTLADPSQGWKWSSGEPWGWTKWAPCTRPYDPNVLLEPNNLSPDGPSDETENWENAVQLNYYDDYEGSTGYYWNDIGGRADGMAYDWGWLPYGYVAERVAPGLPAIGLLAVLPALRLFVRRRSRS